MSYILRESSFKPISVSESKMVVENQIGHLFVSVNIDHGSSM